jgi:hypothetical protein
MKEAKFIWDIPTNNRCRFYLTHMQQTGEISPRNWFSVIAMGDEIEMTVEDTALKSNRIDTSEFEAPDEPSARQICQSEDKLLCPGVPEMRDSYTAVISATPERRKPIIL